jgi:methanol--5-hydroxybenzimidazolylcobamide Co-methyltransferase
MIGAVCQRTVELEVPGLLVEFETLPVMTVRPQCGLEITRLLADTLGTYHEKHGLRTALRLTPNDTRELERPPRMGSGKYWEGMLKIFEAAGKAGADLLGIESTGGKEVSDEALMATDLRTLVFALGVLAPRDMAFLWKAMVAACERSGMVPSRDTACGFANTAMVLAEQNFVRRLFAALVHVAAVPRSLVAYEVGAKDPSKDCAYEGPYKGGKTRKALCQQAEPQPTSHRARRKDAEVGGLRPWSDLFGFWVQQWIRSSLSGIEARSSRDGNRRRPGAD